MKNIAIAGNQWITRYLINKLIGSGYKPNLIINLDNSYANRIAGYDDLADLAAQHEIKLVRPKNYKLDDAIDKKQFEKYSDLVLFVFGWQRLIPAWLIDHCHGHIYGVHGGPFPPPRCRGQAVFNWSLIAGYTHFYQYLFQVTEGVDDGGLLDLIEYDLLPQDDILTVYHKNCVVTSRLIVENLPKILNDQVSLKVQESDGASVLPKRRPENGGINWDWTAARVADFVRALCSPYPGAFTMLNDQKIVIHQAQVFDTKITFDCEPGTICEVFPNSDFLVKCADHCLYVRSWETDFAFKVEEGLVFDRVSGVSIETPIF